MPTNRLIITESEREVAIEISKRVLELIRAVYGNVAYTNGEFWCFTASRWRPLEGSIIQTFICAFDGLQIRRGGKRVPICLSPGMVSSVNFRLKFALLLAGRNDARTSRT